jgi:hypothetical protein
MRSEFLLDKEAISGREPVGEKGSKFEGGQAGVGGVDVGIRLNLRFGSTHLAGALRWFLRVRNALARPRHERKVPLLANGRACALVFSGIFLLCTHRADNPRPGGTVATTTVGVQPCQSSRPRSGCRITHSTSKESPSCCYLVDNSSHHKQLIFTFTPATI